MIAKVVAVKGVEVCVPECHFPGTGFFPKKFRKFPVPSIREHLLPGPGSLFFINNLVNGTKQENSRVVPLRVVFREKSQNSVLLETFPNGTE